LAFRAYAHRALSDDVVSFREVEHCPLPKNWCAMEFHERAVGSPMASESGFGAAKDLEREFARAFPTADFNGARLNDSLRHAIHRFVGEAKARGTSSNDIVLAMKDAARRAGFSRPESARSLGTLPADRLFSRAITVCLEVYDETHEAPSPDSRSVDADHDSQLDLNAFRVLLSSHSHDDFTRAVADYVRSARGRGLAMEKLVANVNRILKECGDAPTQLGTHAEPRASQLVIRGLLIAACGENNLDVPGRAAEPPRRSGESANAQ